MMAAHTMSASTFVNTMQVDYDTFRRETLDAIAYVRSQSPSHRRRRPHREPMPDPRALERLLEDGYLRLEEGRFRTTRDGKQQWRDRQSAFSAQEHPGPTSGSPSLAPSPSATLRSRMPNLPTWSRRCCP
jgi:hypothetical protein